MNSVTEHLRWMCDRLRANEPFCHLRFNDGEAIAMGLVEGGDANCDGHRYFPDMIGPLRSVWLSMLSSGSDVLIGSIIKTDPTHPASLALKQFGQLNTPLWSGTVGEFWCQEEKVEGWAELQELFALTRERDTILVCNQGNWKAHRCLGTDYEVTPNVDAWLDRQRVMRRLLFGAGKNPIFFWACGFPGKVWAWMLKTLIPGSTHIDIGHTFDGVYGNKSREWMKRDSEMSRFYFDTFAPWVRSFE